MVVEPPKIIPGNENRSGMPLIDGALHNRVDLFNGPILTHASAAEGVFAVFSGDNPGHRG